MKIEQAKEIELLGLAGSLCVITPQLNKDHSNLTCHIKRVFKGWVTVRCGEGDFNLRAKHIETLKEAKVLGWR